MDGSNDEEEEEEKMRLVMLLFCVAVSSKIGRLTSRFGCKPIYRSTNNSETLVAPH